MNEQISAKGINLYRTGKYSDALAFFLSLSPENSDDLENAYYIGLCYMKLKRFEDALLYLEQVVTTVASDEITRERILQCRLVLAVVYTMSGRNRLAEFELKSLLDAGYRPASVYAAMAYIAWNQNNFDTCVEYYEKVLEIDSENITAMNGLGYVLASMDKDLTRALMLSKRALDLSPDSAACLDTVGWVYYKLGLLKEAESFLKKAQEKDSTSQEIADHMRIIHDAITSNTAGGRKA
ncbi:MAG: tetratricopeptide repeat protein [Spirochaetaceae bacterium]|nr:tetratricopeptide repeat protein [Spirochaetaceae bacterium]